MSDLEGARERLAAVIGRTLYRKGLWHLSDEDYRWFLRQTSGFLNGETVKLLEAEIVRLKSGKYGLYEDVCVERDQLREQLAELQQRYDNAITLCETMTTKFAEVKEQAVDAERERLAVAVLKIAVPDGYDQGQEDAWDACLEGALAVIRRPPEEEGK